MQRNYVPSHNYSLVIFSVKSQLPTAFVQHLPVNCDLTTRLYIGNLSLFFNRTCLRYKLTT